MNYANIIRFLAKQHGIDYVDFNKDVILFSQSGETEIHTWNLNFKQPTELEMIAAESDAENYIKSDLVRKKRDILLSETDWLVVKDVEATSTVPQAWKDYRKALRDLPEDPNFPNIDFPTKPID